MIVYLLFFIFSMSFLEPLTGTEATVCIVVLRGLPTLFLTTENAVYSVLEEFELTVCNLWSKMVSDRAA